MIFISLALPCLKRFINTSVKYVYVWHPRLWYHSQRPRPALADGAAFETVNRAACFKRFKQCFKTFCLKLFLCVSILDPLRPEGMHDATCTSPYEEGGAHKRGEREIEWRSEEM